ncbi:MAG: dehydratase [Rhizobiales bacterium]|nr:dehydratase [Hyphomicrobiales bacterium]
MGRYFEEFALGEVFETYSRTITEADLVNFAGMTGDNNPLHMDEEFAAATPFGGRIAHGPFFVGLTFGLLSQFDLLERTVMALRRVSWQFEGPVKPGDTVRVRAEVTELKENPGKADRGNLSMDVKVLNQRDEEVQSGSFTAVMARRPV